MGRHKRPVDLAIQFDDRLSEHALVGRTTVEVGLGCDPLVGEARRVGSDARQFAAYSSSMYARCLDLGHTAGDRAFGNRVGSSRREDSGLVGLLRTFLRPPRLFLGELSGELLFGRPLLFLGAGQQTG